MTPYARALAPLLALAVALAGCAGDAAEQVPAAPVEPAPGDAVFEPPFALVPPEIEIASDAPLVAGAPVGLRAAFPASVDRALLRDVLWEFGDGGLAVGFEVDHAYAQGGAYEVRVSVRDAYDRNATQSLRLGVAQPYAFQDTVAVGDGAADARPREGDAPHDHVDHAVEVPEGATALRATLAFSPEPTCAQPPLCVPRDTNLVLRVLDPAGAKVAELAAGELPRVLDVPLDTAGAYVVRVSGDVGLDVDYELQVLVLFAP